MQVSNPNRSLAAEAAAKMHTVAEKVEHQLTKEDSLVTKEDSLVKEVAIPIFSGMRQVASAIRSEAQFIATSLRAIGEKCVMAVNKLGQAILNAVKPQEAVRPQEQDSLEKQLEERKSIATGEYLDTTRDYLEKVKKLTDINSNSEGQDK